MELFPIIYNYFFIWDFGSRGYKKSIFSNNNKHIFVKEKKIDYHTKITLTSIADDTHFYAYVTLSSSGFGAV